MVQQGDVLDVVPKTDLSAAFSLSLGAFKISAKHSFGGSDTLAAEIEVMDPDSQGAKKICFSRDPKSPVHGGLGILTPTKALSQSIPTPRFQTLFAYSDNPDLWYVHGLGCNSERPATVTVRAFPSDKWEASIGAELSKEHYSKWNEVLDAFGSRCLGVVKFTKQMVPATVSITVTAGWKEQDEHRACHSLAVVAAADPLFGATFSASVAATSVVKVAGPFGLMAGFVLEHVADLVFGFKITLNPFIRGTCEYLTYYKGESHVDGTLAVGAAAKFTFFTEVIVGNPDFVGFRFTVEVSAKIELTMKLPQFRESELAFPFVAETGQLEVTVTLVTSTHDSEPKSPREPGTKNQSPKPTYTIGEKRSYPFELALRRL